jgi:cytochrome d ubiquinol oxidase subunit II
VNSPSGLQILWFALIAVLWTGYFFLEGFDFGVGMLVPILGRDDVDRRMVIGAVGPVWDGNEVWLITAAGATFAAFPLWYSTLFSSLYLPLFFILVALIIRGAAFEFRHHGDTDRWRAWWDRALFVGSVVPALLWGVAFADIIQGLPINASHVYTGNLLTIFSPYAILGGVTFASVFLLHGAVYLTLKLDGTLKERADRFAQRLAWLSTALLIAFLAWTFVRAVRIDNTGVALAPIPVAAVVLLGLSAVLLHARRHGWAFAFTGMAIAMTMLTLFVNLYPRVMVSSTSSLFNLTLTNASSSSYTLTVMTVVAAIFTPIVLLYQAWTYWVFRQRLSRDDFQLPKFLAKKTAPSPTQEG